jgi:hypothetical protein
MPTPSRVLHHMRGLRTLLDARDGSTEGDGEEEEDSGGNRADDEISDVLCALCALSVSGEDGGTVAASVESTDGGEGACGQGRWMGYMPMMDRLRCVSAPGEAGLAWGARRFEGLGLDEDDGMVDVGRRWKSEAMAGGGSDGDCESVGR